MALSIDISILFFSLETRKGVFYWSVRVLCHRPGQKLGLAHAVECILRKYKCSKTFSLRPSLKTVTRL